MAMTMDREPFTRRDTAQMLASRDHHQHAPPAPPLLNLVTWNTGFFSGDTKNHIGPGGYI